MIDVGNGPPIVLIPGVQGRWEWMRPAVDALARRSRTITFSLCGDPGSGAQVDSDLGFDSFVKQIDRALDSAGLDAAALCGVSFGGLIALHYAARHPERVSALILASTPPPIWKPDRRVNQYLRAPRLLSPLFVLRSPARLAPEICTAFPHLRSGAAFALRHVARVMAAPFSARRMAERVRLAEAVDFVRDCKRVTAPTLIVTGEPPLDRVVPVESSHEYLRAIPGATGAVIERTGHIGLVTRPDRFAEIVTDFVRIRAPRLEESRRRA